MWAAEAVSLTVQTSRLELPGPTAIEAPAALERHTTGNETHSIDQTTGIENASGALSSEQLGYELLLVVYCELQDNLWPGGSV